MSGCTQPEASTSQPNSANSTTSRSAVAANSSPSGQTQATVVRIGFQKGGLLPISRQRGELDKELASQTIPVTWSGPFDRCATVLQALNANQADIGGCGDIPTLSGIAAGQPLCIGAIQPPDPNSLQSAIVVQGDSSIRTPADLVGKKVAVNQGGAGEYLLLKVLEQAHIPKDKVERVYLAPGDAGPALYQGAVDAWAVWDPYVSLAQLEHNARRITTTHPAPTYSIMVVRSEAATQNPTGIKAALVALSKDADWISQNPAASADFMVKELKLAPAVAKQVAENQGLQKVAFATTTDIENLQKTADWLLAEKILPQRVDIAKSICPLPTP